MYIEPSQAANQKYIQSESSAMSQGDVNRACLSRHLHCNNAVWVGSNLSSVSLVMIIHTSLSQTTIVFTNPNNPFAFFIPVARGSSEVFQAAGTHSSLDV